MRDYEHWPGWREEVKKRVKRSCAFAMKPGRAETLSQPCPRTQPVVPKGRGESYVQKGKRRRARERAQIALSRYQTRKGLRLLWSTLSSGSSAKFLLPRGGGVLGQPIRSCKEARGEEGVGWEGFWHYRVTAMFGKAQSVSGSLAGRVAHNAIPRRAAATTTRLLEEAGTSTKLATLPLSSSRTLEGKPQVWKKGGGSWLCFCWSTHCVLLRISLCVSLTWRTESTNTNCTGHKRVAWISRPCLRWDVRGCSSGFRPEGLWH